MKIEKKGRSHALVVPAGTRFERWTVVAEAESSMTTRGDKLRRMLCRCDCGVERIILLCSLRKGASTSCGCRALELASGPRIARREDLTGRRFDRLLVLAPAAAQGKWLCRCVCGTKREVWATHLKRGNTRSCGCLNSEVVAARNVAEAEHGMWRSNEFAIWQGMIQRCSEHVEASKRKVYYERGIRVCDRWRASFVSFYEDMGPRPSKKHSLDRIENDKGYEPGNVRWATASQQANNKRNNVWVEHDGVRKTVAQFAEEHGLSRCCVRLRLKRGLTGDALAAPPHPGARP